MFKKSSALYTTFDDSRETDYIVDNDEVVSTKQS